MTDQALPIVLRGGPAAYDGTGCDQDRIVGMRLDDWLSISDADAYLARLDEPAHAASAPVMPQDNPPDP